MTKQQQQQPTFEEVQALANQLNISCTSDGEWIDLEAADGSISGMYRNNEQGVQSAYGALRRRQLQQEK
jgi:hypothetical protein